MPAKIDIPLVFTVTPADPSDPRAAQGAAALKRELDRLAAGLYKYAQDAALTFEPRPTVSPIRSDNCAASFDVITRVLPREGETVIVQLPRPDTRNGGKRLFVQRMNTLGAVVLSPIGCTVNGFDRLQLSSLPGYITARFDGENYSTDAPGVADWGEEL